MELSVLKSVIFDQQEIIKAAHIVPRKRYHFDPNANYVVSGVRRAGKTTLLYKRARDLVESGVDWNQIIYIAFEDERLAEFTLEDFNDILLVQAQLSDKEGYFFLDEIQNIDGWEKFARRLADSGRRVYLTGSNAKMLSSQFSSTLGGRYLDMHVSPYRFDEYLDAINVAHDERATYSTAGRGALQRSFEAYLQNGGFPESIGYESPRSYVESVYQKVLLGDIAARNNVRNVQPLRVLMKKVAESVCSELSYSALHNQLKSIGFSLGKDTVINYLSFAEEAYLTFSLHNAVAKFVEREGSPKYYFSDNGLLGLFLSNKNSALLENVVALDLLGRYGEELSYLKSAKNGIDLDFYVPDCGLAVQVACSVKGAAREREVSSLVKLARVQPDMRRLVIVTLEEEGQIEQESTTIEVVPAWKFLLESKH